MVTGSNETKLAVMAEQISVINTNVAEIKEKLESCYVTQDTLRRYTDRLERIEKIVYGLVAIILSAVILAIVKLVILT
jgi:hypothetical protein